MRNKKSDDNLTEFRIPDFSGDETRVAAEISENEDTEVAKKTLGIEHSSSVFGKIIGSVLIIAGIIFIFFGVNGTFDLKLQAKGFSATIINCTPGVFCIIFGFLVVIFTKPKIKIKK